MTAEELYNTGLVYYMGKDGYSLDYAKAADYFFQAADMGDSDAMNYLGIMYQNGLGVAKNIEKAVYWYKQALSADEDNVFAAHNLGCLYCNGNGVPVDLKMAFHYFEMSIIRGVGNTHSVYGDSCYLAGFIMLEQFNDKKRAFHYFREAARYNNIPEIKKQKMICFFLIAAVR